MKTRSRIRVLGGLLRAIALSAGVLLALLALVCVLIIVQGQRDDAEQIGSARLGAALVLGTAPWNGDTAALLRARLDHALDLYRRGQVRQIILTGAATTGEKSSEAAAGRQYLLTRGVPAEALLLEEHGTTTWQSLSNVVELARANHIGAVLLVSDPFQMLRSLKMAHDLDLLAYGSPTRSSPIVAGSGDELRAILREAWAYLVYLFARQ